MGVEYGDDSIDGSIPTTPSKSGKDNNGTDTQRNNVETAKMATLPCVKSNSRNSSPNCRISNEQSASQYNKTKIIPATVSQTARDLAFDTVYYVSRVKKRKPSNKHATTLRRTVDEMSQKHEILFNGMVHKLEIGPDNAFIVFNNVANEIFKDGQYNWGRVVSVYAFGARIAKHVADTHRDEKGLIKHVDKIADFVGEYVSDKLGGWINDQGGWDSFDDHFPEQLNLENVMWKGLLVTAFGLGALATMVAVR